jgi:uncharacterized membrane protein
MGCLAFFLVLIFTGDFVLAALIGLIVSCCESG